MPERKIYDNITFFSVYQRLQAWYRCADPGIFRGGGGGGGSRSDGQKSSDNDFSSPQLILHKSNGQFQRNLSFFKAPNGVQFFPGGPTFSRGCPFAYSL